MNRTKLIKKIASQLNLNEIEVGNFIGSVFGTMADVLRKGKNINIPEFGKFIVREKKSEDASYRYITFSPSKKFADEINKNFSGLSPVLTKALNINDLSEIKIIEADFAYDDEEFISFVFDDTETELQLEVQTPEKESDIIFDEIKPVPEITEEIPLNVTEETIEDFHVPFLIPVMSPIVEVPKPVITRGPELKKVETAPTQNVFLEPEIAAAEVTEPEINEESVQTDLIITAADTKEEENEKDTEPVKTEETHETVAAPEEEIEKDTEPVKTEETHETETTTEVSHDKEKIEIIEESIISEKEIILKDIEDYIKSKKETEEKAGAEEEKPEEKTDYDTDNYFKKSNVYGVFDSDNNFAADEMQNSGFDSQNVFFEEDFPDVPEGYEFEKPAEEGPGQNVFEDMSDIFVSEQKITGEDITAFTDEDVKNDYVITRDAGLPVHEPSDKKGPSLKDISTELDVTKEILSILASREKAINELNKYGLILPAEPENPKEPEEPAQEIKETEISGVQDSKQEEGSSVQEIPEITFERKEFPEKEIPPEKTGRDYDELNKKLEELNELTAEKESLEEHIRGNVSPEMTVFEKLVEENPSPVTEKPMTVFPDIIIHDPGDEYEDKIPKSLNDALEDVKLDGIIEHLEHHDVIEEKSYDDVFKPADIPFVPVSNKEFEIKKQKKILKFLLYFFFVAVLSILSFFLYKSVLTPPKRLPVDTLGTRVNDSVAVKISPVDSSLKKGSINLNEFEVEKEGDIIYKQNDNGYIIQIAKFDKYSDALKYVTNLDNKNIHAEIERVDLPLNVTEYRIIVGTFETLQEAKSYFKTSGMMLNFIKVITPFKTALPF
ncbi:MAG: HU family DNA-binding protein [Bacteroidetes bacterium]|nr:HU family DNA-binding protein [Bacteroidota bacterium]